MINPMTARKFEMKIGFIGAGTVANDRQARPTAWSPGCA
jgi:hypothetical protein